MHDGGGGGRDLTLERPDDEIVTKVQRPRSPPSAYPPFHPPAFHPPGLQTAHPPTITRHFRVGKCATTRTAPDHRRRTCSLPRPHAAAATGARSRSQPLNHISVLAVLPLSRFYTVP